jgi:hypothetical protein
MKERQPKHTAVWLRFIVSLPIDLEPLADGFQIGHQIAMSHHHAFGFAGTATGVLQQRQRIGINR